MAVEPSSRCGKKKRCVREGEKGKGKRRIKVGEKKNMKKKI